MFRPEFFLGAKGGGYQGRRPCSAKKPLKKVAEKFGG
jgi:hypothetical protein